MIESLLPADAAIIFCPRNDIDIEEGTKTYAQKIPYLRSQNFDFVFISDARLYIFVDIANALRNPQTYLTDDGTCTILAMHSLQTYGTYFALSKSTCVERQRKIEEVKKRYGLWDLPPVKYDLFTVFDYESTEEITVIQNPMRHYQHVHERIDEESVLFIGQPLTTSGYFSSDVYIEYIHKIVAHYAGKKIKYLPHPRQCHDEMQKLIGIDSVDIVDTKLAAETLLTSLDTAPSIVCGFYSAALWNVAKFQRGVSTHAFKISTDHFRPEIINRRTRNSFITDVDAIDLYYNYFKKRIHVLENVN
ncbi:hypothetical protein FJN14_04235 [Alteromonas mediterranea]|uniref:glycosyltransferase family 52 n=1 Tax=Alteromonas mediterranea TaxID=314275 RepID=UPI0011308D91|nr:glycosyltransferase family 52 [Alteromonas mediterranea]QDG37705.1 hypothetical protein FJN14_04235 [Alteromonas mediterranea]